MVRKKVLIVEDGPFLRNLLGDVLGRGLSEDPSTRTIPVLVMTARYLDERTRKFLANEGNVRNYFSKGADLQTLREKVSGLFEGRSAGEIKA